MCFVKGPSLGSCSTICITGNYHAAVTIDILSCVIKQTVNALFNIAVTM